MKKRLISLGLVVLVVMSLLAFAENQPPAVPPSSPCTGFWGSISCFLFGNPENRAGRSWFDRGNVVGETTWSDAQVNTWRRTLNAAQNQEFQKLIDADISPSAARTLWTGQNYNRVVVRDTQSGLHVVDFDRSNSDIKVADLRDYQLRQGSLDNYEYIKQRQGSYPQPRDLVRYENVINNRDFITNMQIGDRQRVAYEIVREGRTYTSPVTSGEVASSVAFTIDDNNVVSSTIVRSSDLDITPVEFETLFRETRNRCGTGGNQPCMGNAGARELVTQYKNSRQSLDAFLQPPAPAAPAAAPAPAALSGTSGRFEIVYIDDVGQAHTVQVDASDENAARAIVSQYSDFTEIIAVNPASAPSAPAPASPTPTPAASATTTPSGPVWGYRTESNGNIIVTDPTSHTYTYNKIVVNGNTIYRYGTTDEYYTSEGVRVNADGSQYQNGRVRSTILGVQGRAVITTTTPSSPAAAASAATPAAPAAPPVPQYNPTQQDKDTARAHMGESIYNRYKDQIVWAADTTTSGNYNLRDGLGSITTLQRGNYYITTVAVNNPPAAGSTERPQDNSLSQTVIISNGNEIASQSIQQRESNQITLITPRRDDVHTESVYLHEGTNIKDFVQERGETDTVYYASAADANRQSNPQGRIQVEREQYVNTNFEEETQTIIHTGTGGGHEELTGDYDRSRREADRFIPSSGTEYDAQRNPVALLDYDYGDSDRRNTLQQVERFSPANGKRMGIDVYRRGEHVASIEAEFDSEKGHYTGRYTLMQQDGTRTVVRQNANGQWEEQQNGEWKPLDSSRTNFISQLNDVRDTTVGFTAQAQTTLLSIYAVTQSVKDYPALSNLFYGNQDWYKSQQRTVDQLFAPMLGSNWFPSKFCEGHYDIEPAGTAVIKTASGTYQASAHIEMERSERKSPVLCERNQDPEAEQEWRCSRGQVCVDGNFCYLDANNDGEADEETPLEGYFYKITWGVTAPSDEAFTPFRDENGVAVSFNVWLDTAANGFKDAGALPLYNKDGSTLDPIELKNGGRDSDVYIHYSPNLLTEACIHWGKAPATTRSFSGTRTIGDVCFEVDVSSVGEVNWGRSGRQAPSPTVSGGQVSRNSNW